MPNKESTRSQVEPKAGSSPSQAPNTKAAIASKISVSKTASMSPTAPAPAEPERTELLGSLTTQQQQRTSARVIKKLRLEPVADKDKRVGKRDDDVAECETPNKADDKDPLKFPTVKQRMPKALWSIDEKNLFFEALNEYGKDFDAITAYICAKMKKKGMTDANLKTKIQVSHFYYRTWHKLSKHVHFDENVKKVAQELYALINFGELRKKLVAVNEKTCARLGEMVLGGSMVVRARGRNVRVRTPMCRALRKLNQITERACGARVCSRAQVLLRARDAGAWSRVQAAAHNPRAALALTLRTGLGAVLRALTKRWGGYSRKAERLESVDRGGGVEDPVRAPEDPPEARPCSDERDDLEDHLHLETDRIIVQEQKACRKACLHVGPRPGAAIHLPTLRPSEHLSSQKICFSSYLERMGELRHKDTGPKIRTPKRQRKDSTTEKEKEVEQKRIKIDENEAVKLINIDETAIDGIELMAHFKNNQDDEKLYDDKYEDDKEKSEETAEEEEPGIPGDASIPESANANEAGGAIDPVNAEIQADKDMSEKEKDSFSEMEDDEKYTKSDTDNESDGKEGKDKIGKDGKFKNLKVKFRIRPKKRGGSIYTLVIEKDQEEAKIEESKVEEESKPDVDLDTAVSQIRKGWSMYDAGDLTIGDLYLMFGARSKLELDYWWAEPTPPLPQPAPKTKPEPLAPERRDKPDKTPDKTDSSVDEADKVSDADILSPKNTFSQDSNDGMSGDERKCEQMASPEHKPMSACGGTLKLVSKLINRPAAPTSDNNGFAQLSDRLKRLLALAGNTHMTASSATSIARCSCGHVCPQRRQAQKHQPCALPQQYASPPVLTDHQVSEPAVFRHPTPIAPRPEHESQRPVSLEGLPRWRRGRPRLGDRRVVVQRLLPLLPKLPPPSNLIPVKIVPNSPLSLPRILPKPPPTSTNDLSLFYVLSESNGQFFFHDGDRKIPINLPHSANGSDRTAHDHEDTVKEEDIKSEISSDANLSKDAGKEIDSTADGGASDTKKDNTDIANFLPSESLSLSPSRLLRDSEGWLDGSVQDFSLSSFLGQLEGRPQTDLGVDSQLHSLMAESSVDYVAKFADLAAEVTDDVNRLNPDEIQ